MPQQLRAPEQSARGTGKRTACCECLDAVTVVSRCSTRVTLDIGFETCQGYKRKRPHQQDLNCSGEEGERREKVKHCGNTSVPSHCPATTFQSSFNIRIGIDASGMFQHNTIFANPTGPERRVLAWLKIVLSSAGIAHEDIFGAETENLLWTLAWPPKRWVGVMSARPSSSAGGLRVHQPSTINRTINRVPLISSMDAIITVFRGSGCNPSLS